LIIVFLGGNFAKACFAKNPEILSSLNKFQRGKAVLRVQKKNRELKLKLYWKKRKI